MTEQTRVVIVGAGPAGLMLAHLLQMQGIDSIVLESRSREYVEARIRAGVLEQGTVDALAEVGVDDRLRREGLVHEGVEFTFGGRRHRFDFRELVGGTITVYGQHEVVKDLIAARLDAGGDIRFGVSEVALGDLTGDRPRVSFRHNGELREITADYVAGCDGFHGVCRRHIPEERLTVYEHTYPFAWLGILAEAPPAQDELVYASHEDGFALFSMRSPQITRLYLQCDPDEDADAWTDEALWAELHKRLESADDGFRLNEGPVLQKNVAPMRSFVCEPMQYGRLFLAGDAAHIVPPTGAKGMNLAVADVRVLAGALEERYRSGSTGALDEYSRRCLRRIWKVQRFSWHMTSMLHRYPGRDAFARRLQLAELDYFTTSEAGRRVVAENYVGLPL
ncbi:MAG: 4-hydroxybenzoate 3-monooxygenase [Gammaproteobacteria bacterium]|nr:4-hydroxybenzoate 3-monooxygenase [Gammaproteobacteria bacterium]